jgi:hypothetical protein
MSRISSPLCRRKLFKFRDLSYSCENAKKHFYGFLISRILIIRNQIVQCPALNKSSSWSHGMNIKRSLSIEAAAEQLKQAIAANQGEIVSDLATIREKLENIVKFVGVSSLGTEIKGEIQKLSLLFEVPNSHRPVHATTRQQVKTREKKAMIERELLNNKSEIGKAELLNIAAKEWGIEPAPTFLDAALKDKKFRLEKRGNRAFVVLNSK